MSVCVEDGTGARLATRFDDLIPDGDDDDPRARVHQDTITAHAGQEGHLAGTNAGPGAQHGVPLGDVLRATANVLPARGACAQRDLSDAVVRELQGDHGLGAGGKGRARRDANRRSGDQGGGIDGSRANLLRHGKRHRLLQAGPLAVPDAHGVPVACRQVDDGEVEGGLHVLCEHAAHRIRELDVKGREGIGARHAILVEVGNATHVFSPLAWSAGTP